MSERKHKEDCSLSKEMEKDLSEFDFESIDEHKVGQEVIEMFKEQKRKRDNYKKYGPLFIIVSGIVFLTLMFSVDSKITFLILWVLSVLYCAALMIRAEYRYHQFLKVLGFIEDVEDEFYEEEK